MLALPQNLNKENKAMNLNIPPISRIEFWRTGSPPGELFLSEKKTITDLPDLTKIRDLLNGEVEKLKFFDEPLGCPTHILHLFFEHKVEPTSFEFIMGWVIDDGDNAYVCQGKEFTELWELFEKQMFGEAFWPPKPNTAEIETPTTT